MKRKICIITSTRADYGLLKSTMLEILESKILEMQMIVAGTHLAEEFGYTKREILKDKFKINREVELTMSSDTDSAISISFGLSVIGFSNAFSELKPDMILLLGDRYEILGATCAAVLNHIPIAHIHGGEITRGAIDEVMRHAITKLSQIHFTVCDEYRNRVIQMGEDENLVFNVGGLGVDAIVNTQLLYEREVRKLYPILEDRQYYIVTMHPETAGNLHAGEEQIRYLIQVLEGFDDMVILFTYPNADSKGRGMIKAINDACRKNSNMYVTKSLGQTNYLSLCKYSSGVIIHPAEY